MNDIHSNAEAYVVGALEPTEVAEFEQHLTECADCREEVAAMREITAQLSQSVATDPPPALRASILDQIASTPQDTRRRRSRCPNRVAGRHASHALAPMRASSAARGLERRTDQARSWATRAPALGRRGRRARSDRRRWLGDPEPQRRARRHRRRAAADRAADRRYSVPPDVQTVSAAAAGGGTTTVVRSADQGVALLVASRPARAAERQGVRGLDLRRRDAGRSRNLRPTQRHPPAPERRGRHLDGRRHGRARRRLDAPTSDPIAVIDLT